MRLPGYCTECKRIKHVRVTGSELALAATGKRAATGICALCEDERDKK